MKVSGRRRAASACTACARLTSIPSHVTQELLDMFCDLKGHTRTPRSASRRQSPVTRKLFPASLLVP